MEPGNHGNRDGWGPTSTLWYASYAGSLPYTEVYYSTKGTVLVFFWFFTTVLLYERLLWYLRYVGGFVALLDNYVRKSERKELTEDFPEVFPIFRLNKGYI